MITNYNQAKEINETVRQFGLINATPGELAIALARRLDRNTEIKIKNGAIRVQHRNHIDNLRCEHDIDRAIVANDLFHAAAHRSKL
jgi:uncharacterized protein involved in outer membrane biogenesis